MSFDVHEVSWSVHEQALLDIRVAVFVDEQGVPIELEHDTNDAGAVHLLAVNGHGDAIGTARMLGNGHIGRMAVLREHRRQGVGTALLCRLIKIAAARNQHSVFLHAQCSAITFYERLGFVAEGDIFIDAGIEHRAMRRPLSDSD